MARGNKTDPSPYQPRYSTSKGNAPSSIDYDIHESPTPKDSKRGKTQRLMGKSEAKRKQSGVRNPKPTQLTDSIYPKAM